MCLKINGGMPNASRGLSLKKSQPVIRERCKHEYTEIWNCLKSLTKGDTVPEMRAGWPKKKIGGQ
jgi:hypothetical protein